MNQCNMCELYESLSYSTKNTINYACMHKFEGINLHAFVGM